jgi:hypothetical protein
LLKVTMIEDNPGLYQIFWFLAKHLFSTLLWIKIVFHLYQEDWDFWIMYVIAWSLGLKEWDQKIEKYWYLLFRYALRSFIFCRDYFSNQARKRLKSVIYVIILVMSDIRHFSEKKLETTTWF